jgi:hypothetical protein
MTLPATEYHTPRPDVLEHITTDSTLNLGSGSRLNVTHYARVLAARTVRQLTPLPFEVTDNA